MYIGKRNIEWVGNLWMKSCNGKGGYLSLGFFFFFNLQLKRGECLDICNEGQ